MTAQPRQQTVVCDACVLINLLIADVGWLLRDLKGYAFVATPLVIEEIKADKQLKKLRPLMDQGHLKAVALIQGEETSLFPVLSDDLDEGEASSLALAASRGWLWATDESGIARTLGDKHLGGGKTLGTVWILREAIRQGCLSVDEADRIKAALAKNRFVMNFGSFSELC